MLLTCIALSLSRKFYPGQRLQFVVKRIMDSPDVQSPVPGTCETVILHGKGIFAHTVRGSELEMEEQPGYPGGPNLITQSLKVDTLSYGIREMRQKEKRSQLCVRETRHLLLALKMEEQGWEQPFADSHQKIKISVQ